MRQCTKCHSTYPLPNFSKRHKGIDGLHSWCKSCCSKHARQKYSELSPEQRKVVIERNRQNRLSRPEHHRDIRLRSDYSITAQDYALMLEKQLGGCAICGKINRNEYMLSIDHDHSCCAGKKSCGKCVRGLLCNGCNRGLGFFEDSIMVLNQAIAYLSK